MAGAVYWVGGDGNVYLKSAAGVQNLGSASAGGLGNSGNFNLGEGGFESNTLQQSVQAQRIQDPNPSVPVVKDAATTAADLKAAQDAADRANLKGRIKGHSGEVDAVYGGLFGDLDALLKSRDSQLESQYGDQLKSASDKYAEAIPQIETSYASIGAGDSTDNTYAKVGAKKGFDDTTSTIGKNKVDDKAKLGQYGVGQRAKIQADLDAAHNALGQVDSTTDVASLRDMANNLDKNLSDAQVTKATLGTDQAASRDLSAITADNGRYQSAMDALDGIMKSSLGGDVKKAAVDAVSTSSGLTDEEKKKVQAQFGNVYAEQAAI